METINIKIQIPTSKDDITIEDWIKYDKINQPDVDEEFLQKKTLEIFCKVPKEYSHKLKQIDVVEVLSKLNDVITQKPELILRFTFEGVEYGLIPDFDRDITAGELMDLDRYYSDKEYLKLLSILYRPIVFENGDLYKIAPYESSHSKFLKLSYKILEGVLSFFLRIYEKLTKASLKYIQKLVKKEKIMDTTYQEKLNSLLNGVDTLK